jgi:hypothetical protein
MPEEANADEANYWKKYSAKFAESGAEKREQAARDYQHAIEMAELDESVAADFAENSTDALKGERPMSRSVVGELLAAKAGIIHPMADGTPLIMANGEPGVYYAAKRPDRNDRRRRRGEVRYTPEPVKGWSPSYGGSRPATSDEIAEMLAAAEAARAAEEADDADD